MDAVLYIHGKGGSAAEVGHYKRLFPSCEMIGIEYKSSAPWDAGKEIYDSVREQALDHEHDFLIANSIGAYYAMIAEIERLVDHAYFISPIADMEKLITDMMDQSGVTEPELREKSVIHTDLGEDLSWE